MSSAARSRAIYPEMLFLALLLLPVVVAFASGESRNQTGRASSAEAEDDRDLQCVCVKTTSQVRPRHITSLEVIKAGPHCPTAQLIATLRNGRKICLDLQAPLYKKIIKKHLER
ncbi:platelet factor 4 variant isoform X1 [Macaca thibetana thibetana]|uniref:platelet factor 4 variant isoform X1 n=1 Tax=Macaca thibetana thibetana TaxID=257877 RepID=UPI0021BCBD78|nr:platelet factor 4 variant isoform X1 [Macaca thibetana thibetana]